MSHERNVAGVVLTDAAYLLAMANQTRSIIGHTTEGRLHAERLEHIAIRISEASPRWISLAERAPDEEGRYAILYRYKDTGRVRIFIGDFLGDGWSCEVRNSTITHWMPLPEPPK